MKVGVLWTPGLIYKVFRGCVCLLLNNQLNRFGFFSYETIIRAMLIWGCIFWIISNSTNGAKNYLYGAGCKTTNACGEQRTKYEAKIIEQSCSSKNKNPNHVVSSVHFFLFLRPEKLNIERIKQREFPNAKKQAFARACVCVCVYFTTHPTKAPLVV